MSLNRPGLFSHEVPAFLLMNPKQIKKLRTKFQDYELLILDGLKETGEEILRRNLSLMFPSFSNEKVANAVRLVCYRTQSANKPRKTKVAKSLPKKVKEWLTKAKAIHHPSLATCSYPQFLASKYWLCIRNAKLEQHAGKCERCNKSNNLQVHHLDYKKRGFEHENFKRIILLCDGCHNQRHKFVRIPV